MTPHSFYLAGPMTGLPSFNFPAFDTAAAELRDQGYEIVSPAESHDPRTRELCLANETGDLERLERETTAEGLDHDATYGQFMARDIQVIIDDVDGIVALPEWWKSRGARIEVFTAVTMGKPVYYMNPAVDVDIGKPFRPSELEELLKPGDPGNGSQHRTPAEAVGPPFTGPRTDAPEEQGEWAATREPGHIREEIRMEGEPAPILELSGHTAPEREKFLGAPVGPAPGEDTFYPPEGEERITSASGGQKGAKLCSIGDLDPAALMEVGNVAGFGARKYARLNYTKGFEWSLAFNALMRHALLFWSGEDTDMESELPHMAHAAWQCLCLLTFSQQMRGVDDRHINFYMEGEARVLEDGG